MTNMQPLMPALDKEFVTIQAMVKIYCRAFHDQQDQQGYCSECQQFLVYSNEKLDRCPYGEAKPACKDCTIHCYKKEQRIKVKQIMSYAGPRMLIYNPVLAIQHLLKAKKLVPEKPPVKASNRHWRKQHNII